MSFCVSERVIAPLLWPHDLTRVDLGLYDPDVRPDWRYVPESADEICDWASVVEPPGSGRSSERRIVYQPAVVDRTWPANGSYEVSIMLHGFIASINLNPLGNWTRHEQHAPAAIRSLTLESYGNYDAFECQRSTLAAVEEFTDFMEGATRIPFYEDVDDNPLIRAEQNVFVRVRPGDYGNGLPSLPLTDDNDRGRHARRISSRWRVQIQPPTFVRHPSGGDIAVGPQAIRAGDFVEITVSPVIRRIRRDDEHRPTLIFNLVKIVKLRSCFDVVPSTFTPQPILPIPVSSKPIAAQQTSPDLFDDIIDDTLPLSPLRFAEDSSDTEMLVDD